MARSFSDFTKSPLYVLMTMSRWLAVSNYVAKGQWTTRLSFSSANTEFGYNGEARYRVSRDFYTHGSFIPPTLGGGHYPHFTDGETEARRGELTLLTFPRCCEAEDGSEFESVGPRLPQ